MRVRTEARRRAILDAARFVFEEQGFERATMSAISERLGGSKATLYGYFPSKEELFVACIEEEIEAEASEVLDTVRGISDVREALEAFGREFIVKSTSARPIAMYRMIATLPLESPVGRSFYERGLRQGWIRFCIYLEELMAAGKLRKANAWVAAMHLKGMLEGEWIDRRILNALPDELDPHTVDRTAREAVDAFLRAYGPEAAVESQRKTA